MSDVFHFKQFSVNQTGCGMKVNTDAVLLGALTSASNPQSILDIGTGTGVIALMLAQRFNNAQIDAVEINKHDALVASQNFASTSFSSRLKCYPDSFQNFYKRPNLQLYDLIVSNPPFFIDSLKNPDLQKQPARHTNLAFFDELFIGVRSLLTENGQFWMILPTALAGQLKRSCSKSGLVCLNHIDIYSKPGKDPVRRILVLEQDKGNNNSDAADVVTIRDEYNNYSAEYKILLKDFLRIF